jgi:putative flippase GtrA
MGELNSQDTACARVVGLWYRVLPFRFLIVGGWNFGFSYLFFATLYWLAHRHVNDAIIMAICSVVGITNAFICHRVFTYRSTGPVLREYLRFYAVYGVQIGLNFALFLAFVHVFDANPYWTQAILTVVLTLVSYWGHKHVSFAKSALK